MTCLFKTTTWSILLAIVCSISLFAGNRPSNELTDAIFPRTDPKDIGLIYQMLKVIDLVFTKHEIPYWIDGGTVLGAVRHKGIIPWDDDADLIFHIEDQERILALADEFASYGFSLRQEALIRVYSSEESEYPYVDLAGYKLYPDNVYRFHQEMPPKHFYNKYYWLPSEVNSLERIPFGPITLNAPNDMMRYIFTGYGDDCLFYATYKMPHDSNKITAINRKVRIVDFNPAPYEIVNLNIPLD